MNIILTHALIAHMKRKNLFDVVVAYKMCKTCCSSFENLTARLATKKEIESLNFAGYIVYAVAFGENIFSEATFSKTTIAKVYLPSDIKYKGDTVTFDFKSFLGRSFINFEGIDCSEICCPPGFNNTN